MKYSNTKLTPPTNLEMQYLFEKYELLRKAIYNRFYNKVPESERDELMSHINCTFVELVREYDPNVGVDFPYYIKEMLKLRTYHFITTTLKVANSEVLVEDHKEELDLDSLNTFSRIIDLNSINPDIILGDKHRNLMIGILIEKKTLKELAEEEGVPPDRIYARLYFLIKKLQLEHEKVTEIFGEDMY